MDPDRVHAYLQAACAGLGFDIGEVWWTSDENGSSTLASIGKKIRLIAALMVDSFRFYDGIIGHYLGLCGFLAFNWLNELFSVLYR